MAPDGYVLFRTRGMIALSGPDAVAMLQGDTLQAAAALEALRAMAGSATGELAYQARLYGIG